MVPSRCKNSSSGFFFTLLFFGRRGSDIRGSPRARARVCGRVPCWSARGRALPLCQSALRLGTGPGLQRTLLASTQLALEQSASQQLLWILGLLPRASHPDGPVSEMRHRNLGKPPEARRQPRPTLLLYRGPWSLGARGTRLVAERAQVRLHLVASAGRRGSACRGTALPHALGRAAAHTRGPAAVRRRPAREWCRASVGLLVRREARRRLSGRRRPRGWRPLVNGGW